MNDFLKLSGITQRFGGLVAVDGVDLSISRGNIHSIIGPNGAGKSTLINIITGIYHPTQGDVLLEGRSLVGARLNEINRLGLARTFQNTELFGELSVADNIRLGLFTREPYGMLAAATKMPASRAAEARMDGRITELLEQVGLLTEWHTEARALPFALARKLELARALATQPKLLLLDEPAAGLRAGELESFSELLRTLRDTLGITILLVDHVMPVVMGISDRITVLNFGRKIAEGSPVEIRNDPNVIAAYLGH